MKITNQDVKLFSQNMYKLLRKDSNTSKFIPTHIFDLISIMDKDDFLFDEDINYVKILSKCIKKSLQHIDNNRYKQFTKSGVKK